MWAAATVRWKAALLEFRGGAAGTVSSLGHWGALRRAAGCDGFLMPVLMETLWRKPGTPWRTSEALVPLGARILSQGEASKG